MFENVTAKIDLLRQAGFYPDSSQEYKNLGCNHYFFLISFFLSSHSSYLPFSFPSLVWFSGLLDAKNPFLFWRSFSFESLQISEGKYPKILK